MGFLNIFSQQPYSLNQLISIDQGRMERSYGMKVTLEATYHKVKRESIWDRIKNLFKRDKTSMNMLYTILKFQVESTSGNKYPVIVEFQPNFDLSRIMNNRVKVYCGCADFKFKCCYLLNKRGNLFRSSKTDAILGQALSDAPDTRKTTTSNCCKHIFAVISWINSNQYVLQR